MRGDSLFTKITFNYESNSSSSLTLRSTNSNGKSFTKSFTVNVLDKDEIFDIFLSKNQIQENRPLETEIGELTVSDQNLSAGVVFELVDSLDSDKFIINSTSLLSGVMFDYEDKSEQKVVIKATSSGGYSFVKVFDIVINDAEDINSISLSSNTVDENSDINTLVGEFLTDNLNANEYAIFDFASSLYDYDKFKIEDNKLYTLEEFDYETKNSYQIEVQVKSSGFNNLTYLVTIYINNIPDAIDDINRQIHQLMRICYLEQWWES